jgi:hypothetical protein
MSAPIISRQVSFFPPIGGGKYHGTTALHCDEIAICRAMILDRSIAPIILTPLSDRTPAMVCRRCLAMLAAED